MKSRNSIVAASVVLAVLSGGIAAYAASPVDDTMPMEPATCVSHHPEWSEADAEAMTDAMQSGRVGAMASMMDSSMGGMTSMMGGGTGHMGWGR